MSTKELTIELHVPLSGDMFDDAAVITRTQNVFTAIRELADDALGQGGYSLTVETPNVRQARAPRADAGKPRGPRAKKDANGADAATVTA